MDLLAFPNEVLEQVAFELALSSPDRGSVGPPSPVISLLLTCRNIYSRLSWRFSDYLWFRIYRAQFDTTAIRRRFELKHYSPPVLARQLRRTWSALRRLKTHTEDPKYRQLYDDLWEAYFLVSENDGKNIHQVRWAGAHELAKRYILERLMDDLVSGWQQAKPLTALALWVFWTTMTDEMIAEYATEQGKATRELIIARILPYAVLAYKYPNFLAPDVTYNLPFHPTWGPEDLVSLVNAHGEYPGFRDPKEPIYVRVRFDEPLKLVPPSLVSAAKLIFVGLRETIHFNDVGEHDTHKSAPPPDHGHWDWLASLTDEGRARETSGKRSWYLTAPSAAFDDDFERWSTCWDPWARPSYKLSVYTPGLMAGPWQGRFFVPDLQEYLRIAQVPERPATFSEFSPYMISRPMFTHLAEHHCISPALPTSVYHNYDDNRDEGIWNAWFPEDMHGIVRESATSVTIRDRDGYRDVYETFRPDHPNSHDERTCMMCQTTAEKAATSTAVHIPHSANTATVASVVDVNTEMTYADDEGDAEEEEELIDEEVRPMFFQENDDDTPLDPNIDELWASLGMLRQETAKIEGLDNDAVNFDEPSVEHRICSGIQDVIFTGETNYTEGMAWGHYRMYGRLRKWDGLIALVRVPIPNHRHLPHWVFRGYLHYGKTLVGSWRGMINMANAAVDIPWEGPFAMSLRCRT